MHSGNHLSTEFISLPVKLGLQFPSLCNPPLSCFYRLISCSRKIAPQTLCTAHAAQAFLHQTRVSRRPTFIKMKGRMTKMHYHVIRCLPFHYNYRKSIDFLVFKFTSHTLIVFFCTFELYDEVNLI